MTKVVDDKVVLTDDELKYLESFLVAGDRAGFYVAYYNMTGSKQAVQQAQISSFSETYGGVAYLANAMVFDNGTNWDINTIKALVQQGTGDTDHLFGYDTGDTIFAGAGNDTVYGNGGNDHIHGEVGDDRLYGDGGVDTLWGGTGADRLYGHEADDVLIGGADNDMFYGGTGNDTYVYSQTQNEGQDTIYNNETTWASDTDIVDLTTSSKDSLWFSQAGSHLQIEFVGNEGRLTIQDWYTGDSHRVDQFRAGGETLASADVQQLVDAMAAFTDTSGIVGSSGVAPTNDTSLNNALAAAWQTSV